MLTWCQIAMAQEDLRVVGDKPWLTGYSWRRRRSLCPFFWRRTSVESWTQAEVDKRKLWKLGDRFDFSRTQVTCVFSFLSILLLQASVGFSIISLWHANFSPIFSSGKGGLFSNSLASNRRGFQGVRILGVIRFLLLGIIIVICWYLQLVTIHARICLCYGRSPMLLPFCTGYCAAPPTPIQMPCVPYLLSVVFLPHARLSLVSLIY